MSEVLTFNTETGVAQQETINPLPVYGENHPMLNSVMPEYDVRTLPNPNMTRLVNRLKMTMKLYSGVGLAANQCGVQERVFIIGTEWFQMVCINPKIIKQSAEVEKLREGCLSYPGLFVTIPRSKSIDVEFYTETGELKQLTIDGITAQCFQHELEHLDGKTFTSHVKPLALKLARDKQQKLIRKIKKQNR